MEKQTLKAVGRFLAVKVIVEEEKTESGIIVKRDFEPKVLRGEVIAVGDHPDCQLVKPGEIIYFDRMAGRGKDVEINGEKIRFIDCIEAMAVEEND